MAEKYFSKLKTSQKKHVKTYISECIDTKYAKTINTNNSFGKITSTSVPGGNPVDGLPPASSWDFPRERRLRFYGPNSEVFNMFEHSFSMSVFFSPGTNVS